MTPDELFEAAIAVVLGAEGGFQKDPDDSGNWTGGAVGAGTLKGTKYGISAAAYPNEDIESLTRERAVDLYRRDYFDPLHLDLLPPALAVAAFDCGVNQRHPPITWIQQTLGVTPDGVIGPKTIAAAEANPGLALRDFMAFRGVRYGLDPNFPRFGHTWMIRTLDLYRYCLSLL